MEYRWNAATYNGLRLPHLKWGDDLLSRYEFLGDELVLEAGCGTGRDTAKLSSKVTSGKVVAIDASDAMLFQARKNLSVGFTNVEFIKADLRDPLDFEPIFDLVFSVATLHWISDHGPVFSHMGGVLKPGGRLLVDCGGKGNIASVSSVVRGILGPSDADQNWNFADVDETVGNLVSAGFRVNSVGLVNDPARFDSIDEFRAFLSTLILGAHLEQIAERDRFDFISAVIAELDDLVVDYVRLRIDASKIE